MRLGLVAMAVSNNFGTNLLETALLAVADLAYPGGPIPAEAGVFAVVAAALGVLLTCVYLVGLVARRDRTFLGLGPNPHAAVVIYLGGLMLLFALR